VDVEKEKIKEVLEIIDERPVISKELFRLAKWISEYYCCPIGIVLKAMLPAGINVNTIQKISLKNDTPSKPEYVKVLNILRRSPEPIPIDSLRNQRIPSLFKTLLEMENEGIIEIERSFKRKTSKKKVNYLKLNLIDPESSFDLTQKQQELFEYLKAQKGPVPILKLAKQFSYSIINKLKEKGLVEIITRETQPDIFEDLKKTAPSEFKLTEEQRYVVDNLQKVVEMQKFHTCLLHGITSSGKTEVYIRIMKTVLKQNRTAILLIPEISLTPQTVERFYTHFGDTIAVLHSKLTDRERLYYWEAIRSKKKKIVIGPRSAIFAPLENIGLIIVDEEHENTYKQSEQNPLYHGRDVAVMRGKLNNALVVLGTATPSLESYYNVQKGKYQLLEMHKRVQNQILPTITIVDMRQEQDHKEILSHLMKAKIEDRLKKKEQIILFQNRRGYASYIQCVKCGQVFKCKNCNISLTYHSYNNRMVCHYCGYNKLLPRQCPNCGGYIYTFGMPGTEKIEKNLEFLFPTARIARMDTDTTQKKQSHQIILDKVKNGYVDILLGTQMIIKGLDFPNVTLVGIISADVNLNLPDFRAAERNFQHITQVAGRAGRSEKRGEVVVQTYNPMHYSIQFAQKHDFNAFAKHELALREKLHYSPFTKLARLVFMLNNQERLRDYMTKIRGPIRKSVYSNEIIILGPVSAPISKIRGNYRYHIVIKAKNRKAIELYFEWFYNNIKIPTYIKTHIDIDPLSLL
jgi:primosomal protein N' (replication factor Y)